MAKRTTKAATRPDGRERMEEVQGKIIDLCADAGLTDGQTIIVLGGIVATLKRDDIDGLVTIIRTMHGVVSMIENNLSKIKRA